MYGINLCGNRHNINNVNSVLLFSNLSGKFVIIMSENMRARNNRDMTWEREREINLEPSIYTHFAAIDWFISAAKMNDREHHRVYSVWFEWIIDH